jgi:hypothetical protein
LFTWLRNTTFENPGGAGLAPPAPDPLAEPARYATVAVNPSTATTILRGMRHPPSFA